MLTLRLPSITRQPPPLHHRLISFNLRPSITLYTTNGERIVVFQPPRTTTAIMAANTKYTPAPQRDSFEEPSYSQAPPSYQAEPVMGESRAEDDNLPDDFKVRKEKHQRYACED